MSFTPAQRLGQLPPYLFAAIDAKKKAALARGADIISLGVGDPDLPTPLPVIEAAQRSLLNPANHQYPFGQGLASFRRAVAGWMERRFQVQLNPDTEIHALMGSKDGITHLPLAVLNPGDVALIPEPAYPAYNAATILAGGRPVFLPLLEKNRFQPDFGAVPESVWREAKLLFLNYPNNPLSATAESGLYEDVVRLARRYDFLVAHDAAYSEMYFESPPRSFLSVPGAREVGVEFHSLSKTFNMTGWRVGWVCGSAQVVAALGRLKDNFDSGVFQVVQEAAVAALTGPQEGVEDRRQLYRARRDLWIDGLRRLGWWVWTSPATFYVWARMPGTWTSAAAAEKILEEAQVVCTPGSGFGPSGEGYLRFALTVPEARLREALERLSRVRWDR